MSWPDKRLQRNSKGAERGRVLLKRMGTREPRLNRENTGDSSFWSVDFFSATPETHFCASSLSWLNFTGTLGFIATTYQTCQVSRLASDTYAFELHVTYAILIVQVHMYYIFYMECHAYLPCLCIAKNT